jgi:hypothetical protein
MSSQRSPQQEDRRGIDERSTSVKATAPQRATTPRNAQASEFRAQHGDPSTWTAHEIEAYLDLGADMSGRPSGVAP